MTHWSNPLPQLSGLLPLLAVIVSLGCDREPATRPLRFGHVYEVTSPTHRFGASQLGDVLQELGSDLQVKVYPAAQMGGEAELLEQLVAGEIDLAIAGPSFLAMWHPPIGVLDAAYVFDTQAQALEVANGPLMAPHWEALRDQYGVRVLGNWAYGARHLTANRPIRHPDDLAGFRLRMPAARVWQDSAISLGASPLSIPFSEVYLALQQGIADGQENPIPVIYSMGFHEVQQYLILTAHIVSSIQVLISQRSWQRLDAAEQAALEQAIDKLGVKIVAGIAEQEQQLLGAWRREGTLRVIDDVDREAFRRRSRAHFAEGFVYSDLYRRIVAAGPGAGAASQGAP